MKYLKYFESLELNYWKVSTKKPNLEISLDMIGVNKNIEEFAKDIRRDARRAGVKKMNIMSFGDSNNIVWSATLYRTGDKYKFQGEIEITPEEVNDWKLRKMEDKYNL